MIVTFAIAFAIGSALVAYLKENLWVVDMIGMLLIASILIGCIISQIASVYTDYKHQLDMEERAAKARKISRAYDDGYEDEPSRFPDDAVYQEAYEYGVESRMSDIANGVR